MGVTTVDFSEFSSGDSPLGPRWEDAAGTGDGGLSAGSPKVLADAAGLYLRPGTTLLASGDLLPAAQVTRTTIDVELLASATLRVLLPCSLLGGSLAALDLVRRSDDDAELRVLLTDPLAGQTLWMAAIAKPGTSAAVRGLLTVEAGPLFLRAWWDPDASRYTRRTPDIGAALPMIEHERWGLAGAGELCKVRSVELETPLEAQADPGCPLAVTEDDGESWLDRSSAALVRYQVVGAARARRSQVAVAAYGEFSGGAVADSIAHRLDSRQTIALIPVDEDVTIAAGTLAEGRSGIASAEVVARISGDPSGSAVGGIGSGRASLAAGGEAFLDPGIILSSGSSMLAEQQDLVSDTGGEEAREQVASRQRRAWDLRTRMGFRAVRKVERMVAACGAARPAWFLPPLTGWPVPVVVPDIRHDAAGVRRVESTMSPVEV